MILNNSYKYVLIGGGDHSLSILDINFSKKKNNNIIGYVDAVKTGLNLEYLGDDNFFIKNNKFKNIKLIMSIGSNIKLRANLFKKYKNYNYIFETLVDQSSLISRTSSIGEGSVIFKNVVLGSFTKIMSNVCIHSGSVVEHNSIIYENSYISPASVICGNCTIGSNVFVGAASCLIEKIVIPNYCLIAAGSVVVNNQKKEKKTYVGVPAKIL